MNRPLPPEPSAASLPVDGAPRPLSRLRRLALFLIVVAVAGIAGGLVEWGVRLVLPSTPAVFLGRTAAMLPIFYWMPVILAEEPPWTLRRRRRFAAVVSVVLAALATVAM